MSLLFNWVNFRRHKDAKRRCGIGDSLELADLFIGGCEAGFHSKQGLRAIGER